VGAEAARPQVVALPPVAPMAVRTPVEAAEAAVREVQTPAVEAAEAAGAPKGVVPTRVALVAAEVVVAAAAHWPWPRTRAAGEAA
jgi:ABC-type methionine transport system permease subunit